LNFLMGFPNPRVHDDVPDAFFSSMAVQLTQADQIPFEVTGQGEKEWYRKLPNERVYQPAEGEMSEEESDRLLARQAFLANFLHKLRALPAHGASVYEPEWEERTVGGTWIA